MRCKLKEAAFGFSICHFLFYTQSKTFIVLEGNKKESTIKKLYNKLTKEFQDVDFTQFTLEELKEFDFRMWDENTILMPVWALDCLPDGTKVVSIDGDEITFDKSKGLDKDERFGATAYGFSISQLRDAAINKIIE